MAMLHDLIRKTRNQVPSRTERQRLMMAYSEEFRDGAAMNSEWCRVSLELLADLYANVCQLYPTYQEEKIEKIMWKFYIGLVIINIVLIREEIEGGRGKFIEGVVGIIKNGIKQDGFGLGKSIISTAYELFKLTIQGDEKFMRAANKLKVQAQEELEKIDVYYWPI